MALSNGGWRRKASAWGFGASLASCPHPQPFPRKRGKGERVGDWRGVKALTPNPEIERTRGALAIGWETIRFHALFPQAGRKASVAKGNMRW